MLLLGSKANPRPGSKSSSDNAHDRNASDLWRWLFGISIFSSFMVCYIRYTQTRKSPWFISRCNSCGRGRLSASRRQNRQHDDTNGHIRLLINSVSAEIGQT
jgi:hypothetical protein